MKNGVNDAKPLFNMQAPFVSFMAQPQSSSPLQELGAGPVELPSKAYAGMTAYNHFQAEFAHCKAVNDCIHGTLTCERMCQAKAKQSPYYQAAVHEAEMMKLWGIS